MTIENIIEVLDYKQCESIHKIYSKRLKFCFITAPTDKRYKLTSDMDDYILTHFTPSESQIN